MGILTLVKEVSLALIDFPCPFKVEESGFPSWYSLYSVQVNVKCCAYKAEPTVEDIMSKL